MAYVSGTAATFAELVAGIRNACTANGWTLSGEVLHKGTVYQRVRVEFVNFVDSMPGTGIDGSNNITGGAIPARIGSLSGSPVYIQPFVFPLTYEVFIQSDPDEVMVVVGYGADLYQWLAWGKSSVSLPGTGGWSSGSLSSQQGTQGNGIYLTNTVSGTSSGHRGTSSNYHCPALFHAHTRINGGEMINHGLGGLSGFQEDAQAAIYRAPLDAITPNTYNNQAVLMPIRAYTQAYGSNKVALVVDVQSIRAIRINNINPGEIITLGPDRWKVYPWYKKSTSSGFGISDTGNNGFAVRYDGP